MKTNHPMDPNRPGPASPVSGAASPAETRAPYPMPPLLAPTLLEALRHIDSCTLANAIETFGVRLHNEGFTNGATRCLFPSLRPMIGHAVTVKIRGSSPPMGARTYLERTDWWAYVKSVPWPRVVVVQDVDPANGHGALLGEVHVNILRALGCVGAVTNGAVRDLPAIANLGFQLFAGSLTVSHSYVHIVEFGAPVEIDGLAIRSGDLLHGDLHGLQSVPPELVAKLPATAAALAAKEHALIALCQSGEFTLEKLRAAVAAQGA
jgi:4-hydroxy-4-methyl-2-oxoglutarate aldolase